SESLVYDEDGRLASLAMNGSTLQDITYDSAGNVVRESLGNGVVESRDYDAAGRVTRIEQVAQDAVTVLSRFDYIYDAVGNPLTVTGSAGAETYTYDSRNRLVKVCYTAACSEPGSFIEYAYDGVGNRLSETRSNGTTTYTYDAADELAQTTGPAPQNVIRTYSYDP